MTPSTLAPTPSIFNAPLSPILYGDDDLTPFFLLGRRGALREAVSPDYATFVRGRPSFPEEVIPGESPTLEASQFYYLAKSIQDVQGDITHFSVAPYHKAPWGRWIRVRTLDIIQNLQKHAIPLPHRKHDTFGTSVEVASLFQSDSLSMEVLYRFFFLDQALPCYTYYYTGDIKGNIYDLTPDVVDYLKAIPYYDFVACITYLGSLLLQAAHRYCRVMYEGVRLMLIRAYSALGIIPWYPISIPSGLNSAWVKGWGYLKYEVPMLTRLSLGDNPGDSYAQHGWELFKYRPDALEFLASITQVALFGNSTEFPTSTGGLVQHDCSSTSSAHYLGVYKDNDVNKFCNTTTFKALYPTPPESLDDADVKHEWYLITDILYLHPSDQQHKVEILEAQAAKVKSNVERYSVTAALAQTTLVFPKPEEFGIALIAYEGESYYRFNFAQYLKTRHRISLNRLLYSHIPLGLQYLFDTGDVPIPDRYVPALRSLKYPMHILADRLKQLEMEKDKPEEEGTVFVETELRKKRDLEQEILSLTVQQTIIVPILLRLLAEETQRYLRVDILAPSLWPKGEPRTLPIEKANRIYVATSNLTKCLEGLTKSEHKVPALSVRKLRAVYEDGLGYRPVRSKAKPSLATPSDIALTSKIIGRRPLPLFFSILGIDSAPITMVVLTRFDKYYASFIGGLSHNLLRLVPNRVWGGTGCFESTFYPPFFQIDILNTHFECQAIMREYFDTAIFSRLVEQIQTNLKSPRFFKLCVRGKHTSDWIHLNNGAVCAEDYLASATPLTVSEEAKQLIKQVHGLTQEALARRRDIRKKVDIVHKINTKNLKKSLDLQLKKSVIPATEDEYRPLRTRFTPDEDLYIRAMVNPYMRDADCDALQQKCHNRPWPTIQMRARSLTKTMLEKDKVFDISLLPIQNYTAKIKKQLEANFEAALNVDSRLKVDEDKNTVEALKARYLTLKPRRRN